MVPTIKNKEVDRSIYIEKTIFTYSIEHLLKKDKVRFYYAIKGRDGKSGIFKDYKVEQLGRAVLFVATEKENELVEFLNYWKCKFKSRRVLVEK